jgi:hypothetical protein
MRCRKYLIAALCVGALSQSLAAEPPPASTVPAQSTPAPAQSTTVTSDPVAPSATAAAKPASPADKVPDAQDKALRSQGYKPEVRNGVTVYCRKETHLGSRFDTKVCGSPEELADATVNSKDMTGKAQRALTNGLDK